MFMCCTVVLELVEGSQLLPSTVADIIAVFQGYEFLKKKNADKILLSIMLIYVVCF